MTLSDQTKQELDDYLQVLGKAPHPDDVRSCDATIHPIVQAINQLDRSTIDRMLGKGKPGGPLQCFGSRTRNGKMEVFERGGLAHVMWCKDENSSYVIASKLNELVVEVALGKCEQALDHSQLPAPKGAGLKGRDTTI